ncbi:hypothetical protein BDR07DRAFT_1487044 [Suillus spraguei]|nr:hypothetical protein BDR07DRAFT_1487044 [Suillus spraguei]
MENEAKVKCARHMDQVKMELEALCNPSEAMRLQSLESLSGVVGQLLDIIYQTTGWHGSMYLRGPDPQVNGEVHVFSFHHGKGVTGFNFWETLTDHHGHIIEPFTAFLKGMFSNATTMKSSLKVVPDITAVDPAITAPVPSIATITFPFGLCYKLCSQEIDQSRFT